MDNLIAYGGSVKATENKDGTVTLAGIAVVFDEPGTRKRDLTGEYFTAGTYYGTAAKAGTFSTDSLFHHGVPLEDSVRARTLADAILADATMTKEAGGWLASLVLPMREDYEKEIAELAEKGKLGWSTGSAGHMVRKELDGMITRWPIVEVSLTPVPAEPRTTVVPVKSLYLPKTDHTAQILTELNKSLGRAAWSGLASQLAQINRAIRA